MKRTSILALLVSLGIVSLATAVVVDFDELPTTTYVVGNSFTSGGVQFDVIPYNGTGSTLFISSSTRGGITRNVFMNNSIGLGVTLPANTNLISFAFGDFCTSCSTTGITVNGTASPPTTQLSDLDGMSLGGAAINVVQGPAAVHRMTLAGPITTFAIGGTELWFDNLRISVPEPGTILLLCGGLTAFMLRRFR